jgi:hypothetical protein
MKDKYQNKLFQKQKTSDKGLPSLVILIVTWNLRLSPPLLFYSKNLSVSAQHYYYTILLN